MAAALMIETLFTSFERYVRDLGVECGGHAQEFELPLHVLHTMTFLFIKNSFICY